MKDGKYSISDVAQMLGVSNSTVSRAINGTPGVGPELRKKVLDFIEQIGYRPNSLAQGLSKGRINIIALILGDIRNPFYSSLVFTIQQVLNENGYMVMVFNSEYHIERELEILSLISRFNFAGVILITAQEKKISEQLNMLQIPKVLVNRVLPNYSGDSVLVDNFQAGYSAVVHLLELGHERIGFIKGPEVSSASSQRFSGYLQAIKNYALQFNSEDVYESDLKLETGEKISNDFISKPSHPSAMIVINDMTSIGFINGCRKAGIKIPEQLSVISFDNIEIAGLQGIDLTTFSQHTEEMGAHAARLILKQLNDPQSKPERIILEPDLILRKTTCQYKP